MTSSLINVRSNGQKWIFYLLYPIFKTHSPVETFQERQENLAGYVAGVVSPIIPIENAFSAFTQYRGIDFYVFADSYTQIPFYVRPSPLRSTPLAPETMAQLEAQLHWTGQLFIGDRNWPIFAVPEPHSPIFATHNRASTVLWSGLLMTLAVGVYVLLLTIQRARLQVAFHDLRLLSQELADANSIVMNTPTILYRLRGEPSLPMIYVSENVSLWGYDAATMLKSPEVYREIVYPEDTAKVRDFLTSLQKTTTKSTPIEFRIRTAGGESRWVENQSRPIRDEAGRLVEIEGLLIDITERKAAEEKIEQLARTDPLTGLANRTTFMERLQQTFAAARRGAPGFAVLYLDIDRFKQINDTLGHPVGDRFLVTVAERIKTNIREIDLAARLGGDEFAILQVDLRDPAGAGTLAAKLRAEIAKPVEIDEVRLHVTASVGIAVFDPEAKTAADMLARADLALYRAKEEGRDQYRFHTRELDTEVREEVALAEELRKGLEEGQFELYYQPQVDLSSGRIVGMEALIRWNHPTRGLVAPQVFLPIAERTGIITAVGRWVLDRACQQMSQWRERGVAPSSVAVNVSPIEMRTAEEYERFFTETLAKWNLAPNEIELDVTESALAHLTLVNNNVLERLHKRGVNVAIDDFGAQYSTLRYLTAYRVNRIKIPRSLVESAMHNPDSTALVRAIVDIARELQIDVVAQAVETEEQWSFLSTTSPTTKVQGYYYSEPVPADRAEELLRRGYILHGNNQHITVAARKE